jgi:hypothetical protein
MNERIKLLAEQAWKEILDETSIDGDVNTMFSSDEVVAFETKFAELIVKECMTVARGADGLDATHEAWYLIEHHFGIGMSMEDKKTLIKELLGVKND